MIVEPQVVEDFLQRIRHGFIVLRRGISERDGVNRVSTAKE
jgi:hypothetical protein